MKRFSSEQEASVAGHEVFNLEAEVNSFQEYRGKLAGENPDLSEEIIFKQALIGFNTMMFPKQVETYLAEKAGEAISRVEQRYEVVDGRLVDPFYGWFKKMIDFATSDEERETLIAFEQEAVRAKPGEIITVLDTSALGRGGGVKYLDTFEKEEDGSVKHKERIDLTGEGKDLSFEEAKIKLELLKENQEIQPTGTVLVGKEARLWLEVLPIRADLEDPSQKLEPVEVAKVGMEAIGSARSLVADQVFVFEEKQMEFEELPKQKSEIIENKEYKPRPTRTDLVIHLKVPEVAEILVAPVEPARTLLAGGLVREEAVEEEQVIELNEPEIATTRTDLVVPEREQEQEEQVIELNEPEITTTRTDLVGSEVLVVPVEPARRVLAGGLVREETIEEEQEIEMTEPPIYKFSWSKLKPLALADIPEWIWQWQAASIDEAVDWDLLLVMVFYALLSTKLILNIDREEEINDWPGERLKVKANN